MGISNHLAIFNWTFALSLYFLTFKQILFTKYIDKQINNHFPFSSFFFSTSIDVINLLGISLKEIYKK